MSRSTFILAVTLLVVAGSLAFMISFDRDRGGLGQVSSNDASSSEGGASIYSQQESRRAQSGRDGATSLSLPNSATSHLDRAQLARVDAILSGTRRDARTQLDKLSRQYKLSKEQRREAFPLIVAHHEQAHPAMMVGGRPLPSIAPGATLNDSLAAVFDSTQLDELTESAADHDAWWEDVVGQLEVDLDTAIDNGEMVRADEDSPRPGIIVSDEPAAGDGESSSHSGGNLFDLLGR